MSVLYTCGNKNLNSVKLVANAIKKLISENENDSLSKIVLFSAETTRDNIFTDQVNIYKRILGDRIRIEDVTLSADGTGESADFTAVFNEDSLKYVDLTNGQKYITAQLYLAASLIQIKNIYYASLLRSPAEMPEDPSWGNDYEYIQLPPFTGIANLSRISYFDFIFYIEEIDIIFDGTPDNSFVWRMRNDLKKSVSSFFQGDNLCSAVSDATKSSEALITYLLDFLRSYLPAIQFSNDFGIRLYGQQDPLGAISFFFNKYSKETSGNRNYMDDSLEPILTVPSLLTPLRSFRNIAAHSSMSSHKFEVSEVRICINLALEIFRCARSSKDFWKNLSEKK
jgi:hypothetical protein